jgi:hypothetical protein
MRGRPADVGAQRNRSCRDFLLPSSVTGPVLRGALRRSGAAPIEELASFRHFDAVSGVSSVSKMPSVERCVDLARPVSVVHNLRVNECACMRPLPKVCRNREGIDPLVLPPDALVAVPVQLAMVQLCHLTGGASGSHCQS